jgi:hypothetical protein
VRQEQKKAMESPPPNNVGGTPQKLIDVVEASVNKKLLVTESEAMFSNPFFLSLRKIKPLEFNQKLTIQ